MQSSSIHIITLGSFRVHCHGRVVDVGRNKNKALLAFLAINSSRVYQRDFVADLLWCDSNAEKARHSLKQSIYEIKRVLPNALSVTATSIGCDSSQVDTDVREIFHDLTNGSVKKAVDLLRGELLQDVVAVCGKNFEMWCSEFNRNLLSQVDQRIEALLPSLSSREMTDLSGSLLAGVPMPNTAAALARLSQQVKQAPKDHQTKDVASVLPFIGRQRQLDELMSTWEECLAGRAQFVAVVGKAGFGKTRLAKEFRQRVEKGDLVVLQANCYQSERRIGFSAATDLITSAFCHVELSQIENIWVEAIGELLPTESKGRATAPVLSPAAAQMRLYEAIRHVVEHLAAKHTVLILLEDGQWCDRSSQSLFVHLSHRVKDARLFVLVTIRDGGAVGEKRPWLDWQRVKVEELSEIDVQTAIDAIDTPNGFPTAQQLLKASGGSPYFLTEVIRFSEEGGPIADGRLSPRILRGTSSFIRTMFVDLPPSARRCLEALAVIGRPISLRALRVIARVPDIDLALQHLISDGLAILQQRKIALRHDLLREAVYRRTRPLRRAELHRRAARMCSQIDQRAGETAHHYFRAGERRNAYKFALLGSRQADARYANDESISLLKLALKSLPKKANEVRPKLIERLQRAHRFAEAREEIRKYCAHADSSTAQEIIALKLLDIDLAKELCLIDGPTLRRQIAALQKEQGSNDNTFVLTALIAQARSAFHESNKVALVECINHLRSFSDIAGPEQRCEAMVMAARLHALVHSVHQANQWLDELRPYFDRIGDHEKRLRMLSIVAAVKYQAGDLNSAEDLQRDILFQTERIGAMILWPLVGVHQHMVLIERGKYDEATILAEELSARGKDFDAINLLIVLNANVASMHLEVGDYVNAQRHAETAFYHLERGTSAWIG
jgi:hypothetical protein